MSKRLDEIEQKFKAGGASRLLWSDVEYLIREARARERLRTVLFGLLLNHPLPWHVESDWTQEVRAADGFIIAKCSTGAQADDIIADAKALQVEIDEGQREVEKLIASANNEPLGIRREPV